ILFNQRVAETLSDAGHNVTLLRLHYMEYLDVKSKTREDIQEWIIDGHVTGLDLRKFVEFQVRQGFADESFFGHLAKERREVLSNTSVVFAKGCEIIFSFGSIANASLMPIEWKRAFMEAFGEFPRTQFFMRYSANDMDDFKPKNVELMKWLPQIDLLNHPKTKAFITHAGFNSLQESINSAIPLVAIPLFGDQFKNGQIIKKHKLGFVLSKSNLNKDSIVQSINEILQDKGYSEAVSRMKKMIEMDPFPAEEKLVKWVRFLGEFQNLDNLKPVGSELDFVTFHNLDFIL
ncbi:hypothetical protein FO519_007613, partial [Halicephalobus sp. NKZ332]